MALFHRVKHLHFTTALEVKPEMTVRHLGLVTPAPICGDDSLTSGKPMGRSPGSTTQSPHSSSGKSSLGEYSATHSSSVSTSGTRRKPCFSGSSDCAGSCLSDTLSNSLVAAMWPDTASCLSAITRSSSNEYQTRAPRGWFSRRRFSPKTRVMIARLPGEDFGRPFGLPDLPFLKRLCAKFN